MTRSAMALGLWTLALCLFAPPREAWATTNGSISCTVDIVFSPDADGDGLTDANEDWLGTDPRKADTDGDNMPDGWEIAQRLDPTNTVDGLLDSDADGAPNAHEYVAGTDPHDSSSVLSMIGFEFAPCSNAVVVAWSSVTGRVYDVSFGSSLSSPSWQRMESNMPGHVSGRNVWLGAPPAQGESFFYRIRVKKEE